MGGMHRTRVTQQERGYTRHRHGGLSTVATPGAIEVGVSGYEPRLHEPIRSALRTGHSPNLVIIPLSKALATRRRRPESLVTPALRTALGGQSSPLALLIFLLLPAGAVTAGVFCAREIRGRRKTAAARTHRGSRASLLWGTTWTLRAWPRRHARWWTARAPACAAATS